MDLWPNLLGVFYPMPLWGRIASEDDLDCLCKTTNYDSLGNVKKTVIVLTKDSDSLGKVKKTVVVLTKDSDSLGKVKKTVIVLTKDSDSLGN